MPVSSVRRSVVVCSRSECAYIVCVSARVWHESTIVKNKIVFFFL